MTGRNFNSYQRNDAGGELKEDMTSTFGIFFPLRLCEWCQFVQTPIHFLGLLWCQKTDRLCIWSLVINSWIGSIARTEMNQSEQRIKTVSSAVCQRQLAPHSFLFMCFQLFNLLINFWHENTHLPLLWWHAFEQLTRFESTALWKEKACLISVTVESGDVFISLWASEWIFTCPRWGIYGYN